MFADDLDSGEDNRALKQFQTIPIRRSDEIADGTVSKHCTVQSNCPTVTNSSPKGKQITRPFAWKQQTDRFGLNFELTNQFFGQYFPRRATSTRLELFLWSEHDWTIAGYNNGKASLLRAGTIRPKIDTKIIWGETPSLWLVTLPKIHVPWPILNYLSPTIQPTYRPEKSTIPCWLFWKQDGWCSLSESEAIYGRLGFRQ